MTIIDLHYKPDDDLQEMAKVELICLQQKFINFQKVTNIFLTLPRKLLRHVQTPSKA